MNTPAPTHLQRRFGLVQATALNMTNMMGVGPFITIPLLMTGMGGPQAMLGWLVALLIVIPDGLVWSELGSAMPGSGGSYVYLREGYGRERWGRLAAFLFIWQFVLSGPLEIASGYIGFAKYVSYLWSGSTETRVFLIAAVVGLVNVVVLYRRIGSIARLTIALWIGVLVATIGVVATGATHFDSRVAFKLIVYSPSSSGTTLDRYSPSCSTVHSRGTSVDLPDGAVIVATTWASLMPLNCG